MDRKLETLYDLCEVVSKELHTANEKINSAGGELSAGDVEFLDKLTHILKSLKTTIAMIEAEGMDYSGNYYYENSMENRGGRSNARSRNSYARGGGGGGRSRGRYSREDAREDFIEEIEELMEKAPDEQTRRKFERFIHEMK